jgi:hypothetical protein
MDSVVLETSLGDIQLELYWNHAPKVRSLYMRRFLGIRMIGIFRRHAGTSQSSRSEDTIMALYSIELYRSVQAANLTTAHI